MDSEGFVKYLKQWAGVPHLECHRQGRPLKSYTFLPMPYAGSDIAQTTFHRFLSATGSDLRCQSLR